MPEVRTHYVPEVRTHYVPEVRATCLRYVKFQGVSSLSGCTQTISLRVGPVDRRLVNPAQAAGQCHVVRAT